MASETPDHNAGESEPHASNTPGSDLAILVKAATDEMRTFREQRERGDRGTNVREWLTVALLVSTTIGVFWQVREMIKVYAPIQDQAAAAQQSAAAAKQSADAARESADLARNNAEIQLRPYVVIEGSGIRMTSNALEADLTAKNVGLTPAYKAHVRGFVRVVDFPLRAGEVPSRFRDHESSSASFHIPHHNTNTLGPGRELRFAGTTRAFDPRDMAEVRDGGTKRILVAGAFYYYDVYKAVHYTKYCMLYAGLTIDVMTLCGDHDDTD